MLSLVLSSCGRPAPRIAAPFSVVEASIPEMQNAMAAGRTTSREIVTQYLTRIGLYEETLNAAASINANALAQADALDQERAAGQGPRPAARHPDRAQGQHHDQGRDADLRRDAGLQALPGAL